MKHLTSIIGDRDVEENGIKWNLARNISRALVDRDYRIVTGGVGSLARAVYEGAKSSKNRVDGSVIAILPGFDPSIAINTSDIQIATGLDEYRNVITANSDAVIAIGGGAGTLSEISYAWALKRLIICLDVDGWSGRLGGKTIDHRIRYPEIKNDQCFPARNENDVLSILSDYLLLYSRRHKRIPD